MWDWAKILLLIILKSFMSLLSPFAMRRLLVYLESGPQASVVRPWVWVLALFVGPMSATLVNEFYLFVNTRLVVITEAIITQLIFERALKMRFTDESSKPTKVAESTQETLVHTPSEGSTSQGSLARGARIERSEGEETAGSSHVDEDSVNMKGKATTVETPAPPPETSKLAVASIQPKASPKKDLNLVGRLNNMVSTDLQNITEGECRITITPNDSL